MLDDDDIYGDLADPEAITDLPLDLEKIPRQLWEHALGPLHDQARYALAHRISDPQVRDLALELVMELQQAKWDREHLRDKARVRAHGTAAPLPVPGAGHAASRPSVQINVRLRGDDHERLSRAAASVGLRPTTLARALVLNGVAKMASEDSGG